MGQDADTLTDGEMHRSAVRPNDRVGRYTLLSRVGFGGMGVVFLAHDPELERHVAIKVLHRDPKRPQVAARRLLREARTMARLVHPNVVAVHDVGTHQGHVFIAMEFVRGGDLRAWIGKPHPWREVAQVMLQAARGLAAAHAAGVVHRDFKPDNVMVDRSGRVCVTDFGMAAAGREEEPASSDDVPDSTREADALTRTGGVGGTPAYLAPELFEGRHGDETSDQFAYCVTFFEALWGERPFAGVSAAELAVHVMAGDMRTPDDMRGVPGVLRRLVLRGLAGDRDRRWPSMLALIDALERIVAVRRKRALYVAAGVALAGVIGGAAWLATRAPACDPQSRLAQLWNDDVRAQSRSAIALASPTGGDDLAPRFEQRIDAWTEAWASSFRDVCAARTEWSPALADRAASCLDRRLGDLEAAIGVLTTIEQRRGSKALELAEGLPRPEPCADRQVLVGDVEPPDDPIAAEVVAIRDALATLRARRLSGEHAGQGDAFAALVAQARDVGYPPVLAEVLAEQGRFLSADGKNAESVAAFEESFYVATQAQHRAIAVRAASELVTEVGEQPERLDDAMEWGRHARALLGTLPPDPEAKAMLDWALADLHVRRHELDAARPLFESALALYEGLDLGHRAASVQAGLGFLSLREGDLDEGARRLELSRDLAFETLGPHHPDSAPPLIGLATVEQRRGNLDEAAELMNQALAVYQSVFGSEHVNIAGCMHNLGSIEQARGNAARAREILEPTLALRERLLGSKHPDVAATLGLLGVVYEDLGELRLAREVNERALPIAIATFGNDHPRVADLLNNLGTLAIDEGDPRRAIGVLRRTLEVREKTQGAEHTDVAMVLGSLARAHLMLGEIPAARGYAARALAIEQEQLGEDHQTTRESRSLMTEIEVAAKTK